MAAFVARFERPTEPERVRPVRAPGISGDGAVPEVRPSFRLPDKLGAGNQGDLIRKDPDLACVAPKRRWAIRMLYGHTNRSVAHYHDRRCKRLSLPRACDYAVNKGAERICR